MSNIASSKREKVARHQKLCSDQIIEFTGIAARKHCPISLRRIDHRDPQTGKHHAFLTNHFTISAKTIADIY